MDRFFEADKEGRDIIERLVSGNCINYEFTEAKGRIDLFVTGFNHTSAIEIKKRKYTSDYIEKKGGHYLMEHKYDDLMKAYNNSGYTPLFCVIFNDYIYFWDVSKIDITFHDKYLDNTEVINTGKSIQKVGYLHVKDAIAVYETENYRTISE